MKIFLADDEFLIRFSLGNWLAESGHDTRLFTDGAELVALLEDTGEEKPEVVITDMRMREVHGDEVIEKAVRHEVPLIILNSATDKTEIGMRGKSFVSCIEKNGDLKTIAERIQELIQEHKPES